MEDNDELRGFIRDNLNDSFSIHEAEDGISGWEQALAIIPDLIISDVMMPETDGYQLTSQIRKQIETCHIPIILLTAKAGRDSKIEGLERGADDYINKPFDEEEIHLKIKKSPFWTLIIFVHDSNKIIIVFKTMNFAI